MISYSPKIYAKALFSLFKERKLDSRALRNFLKILFKNNQLRILPKILQEFERIYKADFKILELKVFTPQKLKKDELSFLKEKIREKYRPSKIVFKEIIDRNLIAGLKVQIEDEIIDASMRNSLSQLEKLLLK